MRTLFALPKETSAYDPLLDTAWLLALPRARLLAMLAVRYLVEANEAAEVCTALVMGRWWRPTRWCW